MVTDQRQFARAMRKTPTPAEELLWKHLRGPGFTERSFGDKFRPFDRYVVDFYCHAAKLVVELDGRHPLKAGVLAAAVSRKLKPARVMPYRSEHLRD